MAKTAADKKKNNKPSLPNLHLGCGSVYLEGHINIDRDPNGAADIAADAALLPFADNSFGKIKAYQLIEHLGYTGAVFALAEWNRVLAPGGELVLETPDISRSFEQYLAAHDSKARAVELGWIFGEESPGLQHKILFPPDMLREMIVKSGFEITRHEKPLTYTYEPGTRLICRKQKNPLYDMLGALRTGVLRQKLVDTAYQPEIIEFENIYIAAAAKSATRFRNDKNKLNSAIAENICISAPISLIWLSEARKNRLMPKPLADKWLAIAEEAVGLEFNAQLFDMFCRLDETDDAFEDGYEHVLEKAKALLLRVFREQVPLRNLFENRQAPSSARRIIFFGKTRCIEFVYNLRDRGMRQFVRGDLGAAEKLLRHATVLKVEPFYALWNLAVLMAKKGEAGKAASFYKQAFRYVPAPCRNILAMEMAICMLHAKTYENALSVLSGINGLPGVDGLKVYAMQKLGLNKCASITARKMKKQPARRIRLPRMRTSPVLIGEGLNVAETL